MSALEENTNCAETYATFRIRGDDIHPEKVTAIVGIQPTLAVTKGVPLPAPISRHPAIGRTGIWGLDSKGAVKSTSLERHLRYLLDLLRPWTDYLRSCRETGAGMDFFCYWSSATGQGGPIITPETLKGIADLGAELGIDFYSAH